MRGQFQSYNKDGSHTIRSAIAKKPHPAGKLHSSMLIEPELISTEVLHCENRDFLPFCSFGLVLKPIIFIYEPDPYSLEIKRMSKNELPTSRLSKVIILLTHIHYTVHYIQKLYCLMGYISVQYNNNNTYILTYIHVPSK